MVGILLGLLQAGRELNWIIHATCILQVCLRCFALEKLTMHDTCHFTPHELHNLKTLVLKCTISFNRVIFQCSIKVKILLVELKVIKLLKKKLIWIFIHLERQEFSVFDQELYQNIFVILNTEQWQ